MSKVLVTGAAGFIGFHLCQSLLKNNKVICLDNYFTGSKKNIEILSKNKNFSFIKQNVQKKITLKCDEIYNLACPASPKKYQKNPLDTIKTNIFGSINLLELAKKNILLSLKKYIRQDKKLYLGGFSQGAALSLSMGLGSDINCDGIIAISGYIPSASSLTVNYKEKEIYIAHGSKDTTISIDTHKKSIQYLEERKIAFTEFIDDCGHTISKAMITDLSSWLYKRI